MSTATATTASSSNTEQGYQQVLRSLLPPAQPHVFYSPPTSPHPLLTPRSSSSEKSLPSIASLSLHPVLESLLHLLNLDLPSAHFLCRHAELGPKWESMYVHGILHRIEGDVDNTRAWYGNVKDSNVFRETWIDGGPHAKGWENFLDRVERWRDSGRKKKGSKQQHSQGRKLEGDDGVDWAVEERELTEISLWEIRKLQGYCERKFGLGRMEDARGEWVSKINNEDEKISRIAQKMITGGEGWREF